MRRRSKLAQVLLAAILLGSGLLAAPASARPVELPNLEGSGGYEFPQDGLLCGEYHGILITSDSRRRIASADFFWGTGGLGAPRQLWYGTGKVMVVSFLAPPETDEPILRRSGPAPTVTCLAGFCAYNATPNSCSKVGVVVLRAPAIPTQAQVEARLEACSDAAFIPYACALLDRRGSGRVA
jgi:hypothetical protein